MPNLVVKPDTTAQKIHDVTPESAGWKYVGFQVYRVQEGESIQAETGDNEACLVLLSGKADIQTSNDSFENLGKRMSVFEKIPPYSVYVPARDRFEVKANTEIELAVCKAPATGKYNARLIGPDDVGTEDRGSGSMSRRVHNILPDSEEAESVLVVEVYTPEGNWSSYPPHKHDTENLPHESYLEETYFHKVDPEEGGFLIHRVYDDPRDLDETMVVNSNDVVMVPKGYHPVAAPAGYQAYYLNVMAGPVRKWKFHNDPDHEWLLK